VSRGLAIAALSMALSCTHGSGAEPENPGGNPPWRAPPGVVSREFVPPGPGAAHYGEAPGAWPRTPIGDAVVSAVRQSATEGGWTPPEPDARLFQVAQDVAEFLGDEKGTAELPDYGVVGFSLAYHGLIEPSPELLLAEGDAEALAELARAIKARVSESGPRQGQYRIGVGDSPRAAGGIHVVVALQQTSLTIDPLPRALPARGRAMLRGEVQAPFGDPEVFVTAQSGQVTKMPVARAGGRGFGVELACDADGRRQIEVVARGPQGVAVLANFPIYCGVAAPRSFAVVRAVDDAPATSAEDAERRIFGRLNADRQAQGLPALVWDARAAAIARAHSVDMATNHFVAHVSPRTGSAGDRAQAAGLVSPVILENVARAYSPAEAQAGFMNSPGHRANVLSSEATHVGIGVALGPEVGDRRELYVTQLFYRLPPILPLAEARSRASARLLAARKAKKVGEVAIDTGLETIAQEAAGRFAAGVARADVAKLIDRRTDGLGGKFGVIATVMLVSGAPDDLPADSLADPLARWYGIGIASGTSPQLGPNASFVVVIFGRPR
jgi:uncharacterized protein YkwD